MIFASARDDEPRASSPPGVVTPDEATETPDAAERGRPKLPGKPPPAIMRGGGAPALAIRLRALPGRLLRALVGLPRALAGRKVDAADEGRLPPAEEGCMPRVGADAPAAVAPPVR